MMRYERNRRAPAAALGRRAPVVSGALLPLLWLSSFGCARPQPNAPTEALAQTAPEINAMREALQTRDERIKQLESRLAMVEAEQRQFRYALEERPAPVAAEPADSKRSSRPASARNDDAVVRQDPRRTEDSATPEGSRVVLRLHEDKGGARLRDDTTLQAIPVVTERLAVVPLPSATPVLLNAAPNQTAAARALSAQGDDTYGAALDALAARDFRNAAVLFERFVDEHPADARFSKAVYWRAEALFALHSYGPARAGFEAYLGASPRGERAPDAWLKLGHCRVRLGDTVGAKAAFTQLRRAFPDSPAARMAAEEAL